MISKSSPIIVAAVVLAQLHKVAAHGFLNGITHNGNWYQGADEDTGKAGNSPILITDYLTPTYDVWSREIACGINPQGSQNVITVSPGDKLYWKWVTHTGSDAKTWTHNEGTHRSFIGSCNGDCGSTDPTQVQWVELSSQYTGQQGWDGSTWPVRTLANGDAWSDTIPPAPNGDYLIRNELTALHYSDKPVGSYDNGHNWGTEFYPSCAAIRIQNSGGNWDMSNAVSFPGAYTVNSSGHYNPNIWSDPNSVGIAPVNTFARTASGSNNSNSNSNNNSSNDNSNSGSNNNDTGSGSTDNGSSNSTPTTTTTSAAAATSSAASHQPHCKRRKTKRGLASHKRMVKKSL